MGESFVDLSYRGLDLGRRVKLSDFHVDAGYIEIPLPMPVGTRVEIATDDGLRIEALVTHVHEQIAGSERRPGMRVAPDLTGKAKDWWTSQVDRAAVAHEEQQARHRRASQLQLAEEIAAAQAAQAAKSAAAADPVAATSGVPATPMAPVDTARGVGVGEPAAASVMTRTTMPMSPETLQAALAAAADDGLVDDGKRTEMMAAIDPESMGSISSQSIPVVDDVKSTTVMDAIDISMITGEAPPDVGVGDAEEAEITVESDDDAETSGEISTEMPATASGATSTNGKKKSRGGRRKKKR